MFSTVDTIVAIATPAGRGGLGVVRVSGSAASDIARRLLARPTPLRPRHATFARVHAFPQPTTSSPPPGNRTRAVSEDGPDPSPSRAAIDQVVATFFPGPHSYTGEDTVEISAHGSPVVLDAIVDAAMRAGARLAEPGEFTLRAFLNGRIDLVQAEAVADLIDAVTPGQARAACDQLEGTLTTAICAIDEALFDVIAKLEASLDFPDEGYHFGEPNAVCADVARIVRRLDDLLARAREGRLVREGAQVVILGKPNVGKSSLFNFLVGAGRAIVTEQPGTTRDLLTETVDIEGLKVTLVDTAGLRETQDPIEAEGVGRARAAARVAELQLVVLDRSRPLDAEDARLCDSSGTRRLFIINKIDGACAWRDCEETQRAVDAGVAVSLRTGAGCEQLGPAIHRALGMSRTERDTVAVTNRRHMGLLETARAALRRAAASLDADAGPAPEEFVLHDLHEAREALEEVRGRRAPDELLRHIFSRFCIGK